VASPPPSLVIPLAIGRGRTRPNKTFKCSTQELTQGRLLVTIVFTQVLDCSSTQGELVWQI